MASVQDRSAPNAGTKVDPGRHAPVTREAAGRVEKDSLAAESYRHDGKFAENRDAEPETTSYTTDVPSSDVGGKSVQGGTAPSYVNSQYTFDPKGPHGKNLKEGGFDHQVVSSGQRKAFNAEPGSINDPGRLAEAKFEKRGAVPAQTASNRDDNALVTETIYDGLDRDVNA